VAMGEVDFIGFTVAVSSDLDKAKAVARQYAFNREVTWKWLPGMAMSGAWQGTYTINPLGRDIRKTVWIYETAVDRGLSWA